jgi:DNA modification methylase
MRLAPKEAGVRDRVVELVRVRAGELRDNPSNWRIHPRRQRAALRGVLAEVGYADALLARRDGEHLVLVDGHLRKSLDPDQVVPVLVLDLTETEADKLLASLDPLASLARPDPEALIALLARVRTSDDALADLLEELGRQARRGLHPPHGDPEAIPSAPRPRTKPGDLWVLGRHRLLCGDATSDVDLARLMAGEKADLLLTDPPYGVSYVGKTKRALRLVGDSDRGLEQLLESAFSAAAQVLREGAPIYVFHPAGALAGSFMAAFEAPGWTIKQGLVWAKDTLVLGHGDYHYQHEPILYGRASGGGRKGRGRGGWYGGNSQSSLIEVRRPSASREHPTAKPVEVVRRLIENSTRRDQVVLDPFAGSGSTLVACEVSGRRSCSMEIDPSYCDVVIARFEAVSELKAKRGKRRAAAS